MYLEIVTPERIVLSGEVDSFTVPGIDGEFQVLNNHAPIVSVLTKGAVHIETSQAIDEKELEKNTHNRYQYVIQGGVLEIKNNKAIVLAD